MNHSFPRLLTLLRKEKKISQKEAAKALGVSQALLSHYENGIRECGLDFLVRAASFYQVSCDYLLGLTPSRSGTAAQTFPEKGSVESDKIPPSLLTALTLVFRHTNAFHCRDLTESVLSYLKIPVYQLFRLLYTANSKNPQNLFQIGKHFYRSEMDAKLIKAENQIDLLARSKTVPGLSGVAKGEAPDFSMDMLERKDPAGAQAIQALIRDVEQL